MKIVLGILILLFVLLVTYCEKTSIPKNSIPNKDTTVNTDYVFFI